MKPDDLNAFLNIDDGFDEYLEYIEKITLPCIDIKLLSGLEKSSGQESRFGGTPFLPNNFIWPTHDKGEYLFLGQINFDEIQNGPADLPKTGMLSLFYAYDESGEIFWQSEDYIKGYYWESTKDFIDYTNINTSALSKKISYTNGVDVPRYEELRNDWPFAPKFLFELSNEDVFSDDYLLGYPSHCTLGYDPTPNGGQWMSLITLMSNSELDWCWHDGDKLMVFIEKDKLLNKDFSCLKSDAG